MSCQRSHRHSGAAILMAVMLLVLLGMVGMSFVIVAHLDRREARSLAMSPPARRAAMGTLEMIRAALLDDLGLFTYGQIKGQGKQSEFPYERCEDWLKQNLPDAKPIPVSSTAAAAQMASRERNGSAAIAAKDVASTYRLEVRQFPVAGDCLNVTQFLMLGIRAEEEAGSRRAAIAFGLADEVGALHLFLGPFYEAGINLSRIISRTVKGKPGEYVFLIEIDSKASDPKVVDAIAEAEKHAIFTRVLGSYPVRETYQS